MVRDVRFGGLITNDPEVTSLLGAIAAGEFVDSL